MKLKNLDMCVHAYFMCVLPLVYVHHTFFIINVSGNNTQKKKKFAQLTSIDKRVKTFRKMLNLKYDKNILMSIFILI